MSKKPTGKTGLVHFEKKDGELRITPDPIKFPNEKDEIEKEICVKFANKMKGILSLEKVFKNKEDVFDFTLQLTSCIKSMDLVEVVIGTKNKNPYISEECKMNNGEFSKAIIDTITKKSNHYSTNQKDLFLLLYVTHWRFIPSDAVIFLVLNDIKNIEHQFEMIFFLIPIGKDDCVIHQLFPNSKVLNPSINIDVVRNQPYFILNPNSWEIDNK